MYRFYCPVYDASRVPHSESRDAGSRSLGPSLASYYWQCQERRDVTAARAKISQAEETDSAVVLQCVAGEAFRIKKELLAATIRYYGLLQIVSCVCLAGGKLASPSARLLSPL